MSILLPFRNAEATLQESFQSVLDQDMEDFELLAIDDASTDGSAKLLRRAAARDRRIRIIDAQGRGIVPALNTGLRQARSGLAVRMDADDLMRPGRLRAHLEHFAAEPYLTLSATRVRMFPEEKLRTGYREYIRWQNAILTPADVDNEIYVEAPFAHPSVAFRRDRIIALGGYRDGAFPEDYELWLRLFRHGELMGKIPEVLLDWRDSGTRLSRTDPRYSRVAFDRLRAGYLARDRRLPGEDRPLFVWGAGRRTRGRVEHLVRLHREPDAWIDIDPRKIGNRIRGAPVLPPDALEVRDRPFVLVYVASHGARELIAAQLADFGYLRGRDYLVIG